MEPSRRDCSAEGLSWQPIPAIDEIIELSSEDESDIGRYAAKNLNIARIKKEKRHSGAKIISNEVIRQMLVTQNAMPIHTTATRFDVVNDIQCPANNQLSPNYEPEFPINHDNNVEVQSSPFLNDLTNNCHSVDTNTIQVETAIHGTFHENPTGDTPQNDVVYRSTNRGTIHIENGREYWTTDQNMYPTYPFYQNTYPAYSQHFSTDDNGSYKHFQPVSSQTRTELLESTTLHGNVTDVTHTVEVQPKQNDFADWDKIKQDPEFRKIIREEAEKMLEMDQIREKKHYLHRSETGDYKPEHHKHERREHHKNERNEHDHSRHRRRENDHKKSRHRSHHKSKHGRSDRDKLLHATHNKQNTRFDEEIERKRLRRSNGESRSSKQGSKIPNPPGRKLASRNRRQHKNTDPELYLVNEKSQTCVFCSGKYKRIVSHYKTIHTTEEVFVSRLSPEMARILKCGGNSVDRILKESLKYIKTKCPLCETNWCFTTQYWVTHMRTHTGEYLNVCQVCDKHVCFNTHCGSTTSRTDDIDLRTTNLSAFMCLECNFVQIDKQNLLTHLTNQHGFDDIDSRFKEIILLPSWEKTKGRMSGNNAGAKSISFDQSPTHGKESGELTDQSDDVVQLIENRLKVDPFEQNCLMGFAKHECAGERRSYKVRPWIEEDYAEKSGIYPITQFALYKCMYNECLFSSDDEKIWTTHMEQHINLIDVLDKNKMLNNETRREKYIKFRECPYCETILKSNRAVTIHMEEEHRRSIFQCKHCFYRTIETDNLVLHYNQFHADKDRDFLLCGNGKREFEDSDELILAEGCELYVKMFKCGNCVDQEFQYYDLFYKHLQEHHLNEFKCAEPNCGKSMFCNEREVRNHLASHRYCEFQCLYCENGFNSVDEIRKHMSVEHASRLLIVGSRQSNAEFVYIGNCLDISEFIKCKTTALCELSSLNPKLGMEAQEENEKMLKLFDGRQFERAMGQIEAIDFTKKTIIIRYEEYKILRERTAPDEITKQTHTITKSVTKPIVTSTASPTAQVSTTVTYKCIHDSAVREIIKYFVQGKIGTLNCHCSQVIATTAETGLKPYLDHLNTHTQCSNARNQKDMLKHRMQKHTTQIAYLQIEENAQYHVQRLVQSTFVCDYDGICRYEGVTASKLCEHFVKQHIDCVIDSMIQDNFMVIYSNDPATPVQSSDNGLNRFRYCGLFYSINHDFSGTRTEIIRYQMSQDKTPEHFKFYLKSTILKNAQHLRGNLDENKKRHRMYVFECLQCLKLFESIEQASAHCNPSNAGTSQAGLCEEGFMARKLVACNVCKIVSTFQKVQRHDCETSTKPRFPVNAIDTTRCAFCLQKTFGNFCDHYKTFHAGGDTLSKDLLTILSLDENADKLVYAPGCCPEKLYGKNKLNEFVAHIAECCENFECTECEMKFPALKEIVEHFTTVHNKNADDIKKEWHTTKRIFKDKPIANMRIYLPNGLIISKKSISIFDFDTVLNLDLIQSIKINVWKSEGEQIEKWCQAQASEIK